MTAARGRSAAAWLAGNATLNFWLTNRIPRKSLTWIVGRLSKVEHPVVRDLCLAAWQAFADLDLSDAQIPRFPQHARLLHATTARRCAAAGPAARGPGQSE